MAKKLIAAGLMLAGLANAAQAGGIERTAQSVAPLFKEGRYLEFSLSGASPDVSGVQNIDIGPFLAGAESGDILPSFIQLGAAYKADLNDTWSYALIFDQPFGADIAYPGGTGYFAFNSTAELRSYALTGLLQYNMPSNVSVYGGLRFQSLEAEASIPFGSNYTALAERDYGIGYVLGVAYEKPEIALRVSLTYNSEVKHELPTTEFGVFNSTTTVKTPDSLNLEFQSGIAENTLLFGSIRWVDWSEFTLDPIQWNTLVTMGRPLVSYGGDYTAYTIGLGRRLNENWAIAGTIGYETEINALTTNLGPTDGATSFGLAATYTMENTEITAGIRYIDIGNAGTQVGAPVPGGVFEDNSAIAAGIRIGYTF